MERGEVPKSHDVLREAKSLTHRLPVLNSEIFQEEYYTVNNHILILFWRACYLYGRIYIICVDFIII